MLFRALGRSVKELRLSCVLVRPLCSSCIIHNSQRDEVNFPRPVRAVEPGKVRLAFIPEEWFKFFYTKTGVTGPYVFGFGLLTFLYSKEILIMEHEFYNGISLAIMIIYAIKKFGPKFAAYLDKGIKEVEDGYKGYRETTLQALESYISNEKLSQWQADGQNILFEAKKENVGLQLEAAYRERLSYVYSEVRRRLDYQLDVANAKMRIEQKHMVDWIVGNVKASITSEQENAALKKCISDLKNLAAHA